MLLKNIDKYLLIILALASFLRFYQISSNPPSLYWEEVAIGYDAYSILKTGKDHHGNVFPITSFESFGDFKPSLYFYSTVPFIAAFGLTPLAVRLPSALSGTLTVFFLYLLLRELLPASHKKTKSISLFSALFLSVIPWHILVSRVGFEANLGLSLLVLATFFFIKGVNRLKLSVQNSSSQLQIAPFFIFSAVTFGFSLYTYHAYRVFTPLFVVILLLLNITKIKQRLVYFGIFFVILTLMIFPIISQFGNLEVNQRFQETSAFATLEPIIKSNTAISQDGSTLLARVIHHRYWYYLDIFLTNYLSHFSSNFLFISGDTNPRHSINLVGQLFWIQGLLIIFGLFYLVKNREWKLLPIVIWMLVSPVAAGLTKATPHALRSLPLVIPFSIFSAYGTVYFLQAIKQIVKYTPINKINNLGKSPIKFAYYFLFFVILVFELSRFWHYYFNFYAQKTSSHWQYGYQELMQYINSHQDNYDQIVITRDYGRPAMYFWFYNQIDPVLVQKWDSQALKDQGEYLQFEKYYFGIQPEQTQTQLQVSIAPLQNKHYELVKTIKLLNNEKIFYIYKVNNSI